VIVSQWNISDVTTGTLSSFIVSWKFTTDTVQQVTQLGLYDEGANGFFQNHQVGLFDESEAQIAAVTVTASSSIESSSDETFFFRFESLLNPVTISPGQTYAVVALFPASASSAVLDPYRESNTFKTFENINFVKSFYNPSTQLAHPDSLSISIDSNQIYHGPNFKIKGQEIASEFICGCPLETTGVLCETFNDACASVTCLNGGVCIQSGFDVSNCDCPSSTTGANCETLILFESTDLLALSSVPGSVDPLHVNQVTPTRGTKPTYHFIPNFESWLLVQPTAAGVSRSFVGLSGLVQYGWFRLSSTLNPEEGAWLFIRQNNYQVASNIRQRYYGVFITVKNGRNLICTSYTLLSTFAGGTKCVKVTTDLSSGWHHVVVVLRASTISFHLDGELVDDVSYPGFANIHIGSESDHRNIIGARTSNTQSATSGSPDISFNFWGELQCLGVKALGATEDGCAIADSPCENGGACVSNGFSYSCTCAAGWGGDTCEIDGTVFCNGGVPTFGVNDAITCNCTGTNMVGEVCTVGLTSLLEHPISPNPVSGLSGNRLTDPNTNDDTIVQFTGGSIEIAQHDVTSNSQLVNFIAGGYMYVPSGGNSGWFISHMPGTNPGSLDRWFGVFVDPVQERFIIQYISEANALKTIVYETTTTPQSAVISQFFSNSDLATLHHFAIAFNPTMPTNPGAGQTDIIIYFDGSPISGGAYLAMDPINTSVRSAPWYVAARPHPNGVYNLACTLNLVRVLDNEALTSNQADMLCEIVGTSFCEVTQPGVCGGGLCTCSSDFSTGIVCTP
jgi:hypothetical protein